MRYINTKIIDRSSPVQLRKTKPNKKEIRNLGRPCKETLDVFGRLLYSIALADGEVQDSEKAVLKDIIANDPWAIEIELSFNDSAELEMDPQTIFSKNMRIFFTKSCKDHYPYFLNLMMKIANAHNGIIDTEQKLIDQFKHMYYQSAKGNSVG
ncbi:MAG: TerB family tellurite resistance protein [Reichenbachiella sp.]